MSQFDKDLEVGNLIIGCRKGYFKILGIERRFYKERDAAHAANMDSKVGDEYNSLIHVIQIADERCVSKNYKKTDAWDVVYCRLINPETLKQICEEEIRAAEAKYAAILQFIITLQEADESDRFD